jgi:hypothetical protein
MYISQKFWFVHLFFENQRRKNIKKINKLSPNMGSGMPVVFIHCPYSNPHPPQMGRVWVENNYPLKKCGG